MKTQQQGKSEIDRLRRRKKVETCIRRHDGTSFAASTTLTANKNTAVFSNSVISFFFVRLNYFPLLKLLDTKQTKKRQSPKGGKDHQERKARALLDTADQLLCEVDQSPLLRYSERRTYPTFDVDEIRIGKLLGVGGFCNVYEVSNIRLKKKKAADIQKDEKIADNKSQCRIAAGTNTHEKATEQQEGVAMHNNKREKDDVTTTTDGCCEPENDGCRGPKRNGDKSDNNAQDDDNDGSNRKVVVTNGRDDDNNDPNRGIGGDGNDDAVGVRRRKSSAAFAEDIIIIDDDDDEEEDEDEEHYDYANARRYMEENVRRTKTGGVVGVDKGDARYAIKKLRLESLGPLERARGTIDLAIEAKFLSVLWHPNIVKMRGVGATATATSSSSSSSSSSTFPSSLDPNFFIIMDRLYQRLDHCVKDWSELYSNAKGSFFGLVGSRKADLTQLLVDRLVVAYDLASAFEYMHDNR